MRLHRGRCVLHFGEEIGYLNATYVQRKSAFRRQFFCGKHNLTADVEIIPIQKVNEAYERLVKADVKYRFVIDMASLKSAAV
jgi:D-arabinose 1-dehydrogenase-like Zn-dependent alcohol dehydrogenase